MAKTSKKKREAIIERKNGTFKVLSVAKLTYNNYMKALNGDFFTIAIIEGNEHPIRIDLDEYEILKTKVPYYEDSLFYPGTFHGNIDSDFKSSYLISDWRITYKGFFGR